MFIYTLVVVILLSSGEVTGTVQHYDSMGECKREGIMVVRDLAKSDEHIPFVAKCIQGFTS